MSYQDQYVIASKEMPSDVVGPITRQASNVPLIKRVMDLFVALIVSVVFLPVILIIMMLIKSGDGGRTIYSQKRIGREGREFNCYKFRTMVQDADIVLDQVLKSDSQAALQWQQDQKIKEDPRVTRFGRFLRKTSLDELPQLINIIKGEMSLVGPRPIVQEEVPKYGVYFGDYISVLPGVTGLWQISGRNDTTYDERVMLDVEYVRTSSLSNDLKILFLTIPAVLFSRGAY